MDTPKIKTVNRVVPMIYAYTTPGVSYHDGYIKIGYTEQDVDTRIKQQTHTAGIAAKKEWQGTAIYDDGSGITFSDHDFHAYLKQSGVKQPMDLGESWNGAKDRNEWFKSDPTTSKLMFYDFKSRQIYEESKDAKIPYVLREEQVRAVNSAKAYFTDNPGKDFLYNCKPRFGKTLTVYDLCVKIDLKKILIITNRPAIANSWYSDFMRFGFYDRYHFVSNTPSLKGKKYLVGETSPQIQGENAQFIEFESLQDLKGSIYFGGKYEKYKRIRETEWDLVVIDEAHEGVDTYKTDVALDHIKRKYTLHLSGTPFKALETEKFPKEAIFNWTYADEQSAKHNWASTENNPYSDLPQLNMFTYQMSEIIKDELAKGIEIDGNTVEYAFDLNEFFAVNDAGHFIHASSVDKFLNALTTQKKFPFSTPELRDELKHTLWLLNRVDSAKELAKKLKAHPVFGTEYHVVIAAGDGKLDTDDETHQAAFNEVTEAIQKYDKTITLSVGQLTTGVTIPEWTGVLMLSNIQSPSLYMQAAFRAQNPCLFYEGSEYKRKGNAYVFDFDPARTLIIFEQFANDLSSDTVRGGGTSEQRKKHVRELLNFFPVIGEDESGEMVELDAEKVLSIPRKIKAQEVVKRGFMSNFLFQNVSGIFSAPKEVLDILNQLPEFKEGKKSVSVDYDNVSEVELDEDGEPKVSDETVAKETEKIFGGKVFGEELVSEVVNTVKAEAPEEKINQIKEDVKEKIVKALIEPAIETARTNYGEDMKKSDASTLTRVLTSDMSTKVDKSYSEYTIETKALAAQEKEELDRSTSSEEDAVITKKFEDLHAKANEKLQETLSEIINTAVEETKMTIVEHVEKKKVERARDTEMDKARDRLRGFARTIPSFLMAYGDDTVTLATFDQKVPGEPFHEVTSITLDQFRMLRDGGTYIDSETGEEKAFEGHLFDEVVFDDSVKEFLRLKRKLANYFDEKTIEDIFDYIPPQKTNLIFTPKNVVVRMADMLMEENPGCFDDETKTFIDLYMKSGLYITEIVKRLYQSEHLKELYPDKEERLKHIFEKQVFGIAPSEVIYRVATNFILGFDEDVKITKHNFRMKDVVPYVKEGKLEELLEELYPEFKEEN